VRSFSSLPFALLLTFLLFSKLPPRWPLMTSAEDEQREERTLFDPAVKAWTTACRTLLRADPSETC
jgi:hypothetical protein